jgi:hypothetical protein
MRRVLLASFALLVLSGCKTSGYNPLKIESQEWPLTARIERLLTSLIDHARRGL